MKRTLASLALALAVAGCATSAQESGPAVEMHITGSNLDQNTLYFPGPVATTLQLTVNNPTALPVTLTALDLQTIATSSFRLRTGRTPVNKVIPPNSQVTLTTSVWGRSAGGFMATAEPITIRGTGFFESDKKGFIRIVQESLTPQ